MNPLETIMASEYSVRKWEREKCRMVHSLGEKQILEVRVVKNKLISVAFLLPQAQVWD